MDEELHRELDATSNTVHVLLEPGVEKEKRERECGGGGGVAVWMQSAAERKSGPKPITRSHPPHKITNKKWKSTAQAHTPGDMVFGFALQPLLIDLCGHIQRSR